VYNSIGEYKYFYTHSHTCTHAQLVIIAEKSPGESLAKSLRRYFLESRFFARSFILIITRLFSKIPRRRPALRSFLIYLFRCFPFSTPIPLIGPSLYSDCRIPSYKLFYVLELIIHSKPDYRHPFQKRTPWICQAKTFKIFYYGSN
jgi:hypothetical protein